MNSTTRNLDPWPMLRSAPAALPQLLALLALITLSAAEGGYPLEHWGPAAVLVHLLLLVALLTLPAGTRATGSTALITVAVAYAAWTMLSLTWADDRGAAAIAATRTALMVSAFILFARWRHRPTTALAVVTAAVAGLGLLAWGTMIALLTADDLGGWFLFDRLLEPVGYVNASAAFWGAIAFAGVGLLGGRIGLAPRLIGAAVAPPAAALSILALSRGGLLAAGAVIVLILALLPGRARNAGALVIAGLATALAVPQLLDVGDVLRTFGTPTPSLQNPAELLHSALSRVIVGAVLAMLATWTWWRADSHLSVDDPRRRHAANAGAALLAAAAILATFLTLTGAGPLSTQKISDAIDSITEPYQATEVGESRLSAGLSSGRWDFWTVAWQQFQSAPITGAGADNYRQDFLINGEGLEHPRFPHSLWLRQLGQLGAVGFALMLAWLGLIAVAVRAAAAAPDAASRAVGVVAAGVVGMWAIHGSVDWLQEYGGFTAIVFAFAGLAVAAGPPSRRNPAPRRVQQGAIAIGAVLLLSASIWTAAQWTAERDRVAAAALAYDQPGRALERAERAQRLDPFSEQPGLLRGALATVRGDTAAARDAYADAYARNRRATQPRIWLGVLASDDGDERQAKRWLAAAVRANPRDPLPAELLRRVRAGERLDPVAVRQAINDRRRALTTDHEPPTR